jgi:lipoprotein NlpD
MAPVEDRKPGPSPRAVAPAPAKVQVAPAPPPVVAAPAPAAPKPRGWQNEGKPGFYTVRSGDVLTRIGLEHGQSWRDLARWNEIEDANLIEVGQVLRVIPPDVEPGRAAAIAVAQSSRIETRALDLPPPSPPMPGTTSAPSPRAATAPGGGAAALANAPPLASAPVQPPAPTRAPVAAAPVAPAPAAGALVRPTVPPGVASPGAAIAAASPPLPTATAAAVPPNSAPVPASVAPGQGTPMASPSPPRPTEEAIDWAWPAGGPVIAVFDEGRGVKGVSIGGEAGTPVLAAADGRVVYAGSGLRGYGNLVIVKHNNTYLTAYAHNQKLLVREDQIVRRSQPIAEMGASDADRVKLHFEVRRMGKPVDPVQLLPVRP